MSRNFMYVYERIYKEQKAMQKRFENIHINGRKTSSADVKRVWQIISDSAYIIAQECAVLVNYQKCHIGGKNVVLGEATIILPNCKIVSIEELKNIELG